PSGPVGVDIAGGTLNGIGTINASVLNAGLVQVNPPSGTSVLTINGNYTQTSPGALDVDIAGTTAGTQFDQLAISGVAALNGSLSLGLLNGFSPGSGDLYKILTFASHGGSFTSLNVPNLAPGLSFRSIFNPNDLTMAVSANATLISIGVSPPNPSIALGLTEA